MLLSWSVLGLTIQTWSNTGAWQVALLDETYTYHLITHYQASSAADLSTSTSRECSDVA